VNRWFDRPKLIALAVFLAGVVAVIIFTNIPATRSFYTGIENDGYLGALLAGVFYAISFTSPSATVILANLSGHLNIFGAALLAGVGALLYDLLIFTIARREAHSRVIEAIKARLPGRSRVPQWAFLLLGMVILASPLPDELASGMLGLSSVSTRKFFLLSFAMNVLGIFIILLFR
jgi:uncharacterized membrane protein YdjX (TVP38/TMEM64 family)